MKLYRDSHPRGEGGRWRNVSAVAAAALVAAATAAATILVVRRGRIALSPQIDG